MTKTMVRPLLILHVVLFVLVMTYFVVAHVAGDNPADANIGLGLSRQLVIVLGVPWSLLELSNRAYYLLGCASLNLALHIGWQVSRRG